MNATEFMRKLAAIEAACARLDAKIAELDGKLTELDARMLRLPDPGRPVIMRAGIRGDRQSGTASRN